MLHLLALLLPAHADPATIRYTDDPCVVGKTVYVSTHNARLRGGPSTEAPVLALLPLGTALTVLAKHAESDVGGRLGAWCGLRGADGGEGAMFSSTLSAWRGEADLDEDGTKEQILLSYGKDYHLFVNSIQPGGTVGSIDLGEQMDMGGHLETAEVELAKDTGVPLTRVYVPGSEQCGGYSREYFVAWRLGPAGSPVGSVALSGASGADAPVYSNTVFTFDPGKKTVTRVDTHGEALDDGKAAEDITTTLLRWDGAAYQEVSKKETHKGPPPH